MRHPFAVGTVASLCTLIAFAGSAAAQSNDFSNSATYNAGVGIQPGGENRAIDAGTRDENGNRIIVNGVLSGSDAYNRQENVQTTGGVGSRGTPLATAVGNSLNVKVEGSWNTVIVDSTQINNGTQRASVALNGDLDL